MPSYKKNLCALILACAIPATIVPFIANASSIDGTVSGVDIYAKGINQNVGKINFGVIQGNVHITDTTLTGYAWGEKLGWINLAPSTAGVLNNGEGVLSGYAWGDLAGWINFAPTNGGVTIDSSGDFHGYAWSQNFGWLVFNCATNTSCGVDNFKINTDWRPISARAVPPPPPSGGGSGPIVVVPTPPTPTPDPTPEPTPPTPPPTDEPAPSLPPEVTPPVIPVVEVPTTEVPATNVDTTGAPQGNTGGNISGESFVNGLAQTIGNTLDQVSKKTHEVATNITKLATTAVGSITTKTVTTLGVAGSSVGAVLSFVGGSASFPNLILIILRAWSSLLVWLGLRRRPQPWGTVYDSVTKQPLDPAYVVLEDLNGKEVSTAITDLDGRFGFLVQPGEYRMIANKTNYTSPSSKLRGRTGDELYTNLYFGENLIMHENDVITKNFPMDAEKFDWNEFAKRDQNLMIFFSKNTRLIARLSNILFFVGLIFAVVLFFSKPDFYNSAVMWLYIIFFVLRMIGLRPKPYGVLTDKTTGAPLSFAIIRVFAKDSERELFHRVADEFGHYYCLLSKGEYYITIERKNSDQTYALVHTSGIINAKNGLINADFIA